MSQTKAERLSSVVDYDQLVSRLFKNQLHKADEFVILFARRGASDRSAALRAAIDKARRRFQKQWGIATDVFAIS